MKQDVFGYIFIAKPLVCGQNNMEIPIFVFEYFHNAIYQYLPFSL